MTIHQLSAMRDTLERELYSWPNDERHGEEYYSRKLDLIMVKILLRSM